MKGLIQRVTSASVTVDGKVVSSIGKGLCVLVGINRDDAPKHADWLAKKILSLRLFDGDNDKRWDKSVKDKQYEVLCVSQFLHDLFDRDDDKRLDKNVKDKQYEVLCVSQFTLDWILKGNKPDFHLAMSPELSQPFYENFVQLMKDEYSEDKIKKGVFGAMMQVHIQNDGPVTLMLETPDNLPEPKQRKPQNVSKSSNASKKQSQTSKTHDSTNMDKNEASGDS